MSLGASGTYAINSVDFQLPPTTGQWRARDIQGFDGEGHPVYSSRRQFELSWALIGPNDWNQLLSAYNTVQNTGTVAFDLPKFNSNIYEFFTYSGTTVSEPEGETYFQGYRENVRLVIYNVQG